MISEAPVRERRRPIRGWRGWRGPTEQKPFPSLGWLFLDWTYAYLPSPNNESKPLVYTDEQARRIVRWFEIHPLTGEFVYTRLIFEEAKGWGKSPIAGTLDIGDFAGPVCFDGWDADGEPVGVPWGTGDRLPPWIQIAAVSEDQTANTYGALYGMLAARDGKVADSIRLDLGRTKVYHRDIPDALLEPVTTSAGSRTGQRITKATVDETWLLTPENSGTKLVATLRFNLSKTNGREVDTTNAPSIGGRSVAEKANPDRPAPSTLHYATRPSSEPTLSDSDAELEAKLNEVYRDVPWIVRSRLVRDIRDPETAWDDAVRLFFNVRTAGESRAVDPRLWDERAVPRDVPAGTPIGLGFDGSISRDATMLRGCTTDGYSFLIGAWVRPPNAPADWTVPRTEVHERVAWARDYYRVGRFRPDPPKWYSEVEQWQEEFGKDAEDDWIVQPLDTNQARQFAPAVDRWRTMLAEGSHTHDGDPTTTGHVKATRLKKVRLADADDDGRTLYVLIKGEERRQIDGCVADVLALEAAMTMLVPADPAPFVLAGSKW